MKTVQGCDRRPGAAARGTNCSGAGECVLQGDEAISDQHRVGVQNGGDEIAEGNEIAAAFTLPHERTANAKGEMIRFYHKALDETICLLSAARLGFVPDTRRIIQYIRTFVSIALYDRDLLLVMATIKHHRDYIYHHSLNVCLLSIAAAATMGYRPEDMTEIAIGALFHDVGMMLLPDEIRTGAKRLDKNEWIMVQAHPWYGKMAIAKLPDLSEMPGTICYQTHEREDGSGYPSHCCGDTMLEFSKIVQIADIYDAETSDRSYRAAVSPHEVMRSLRAMADNHHLSAGMVDTYFSCLAAYPVGSYVELSSSVIARSVHGNDRAPSQPIVTVLTDSRGRYLSAEEMYQEDLSTNLSLRVMGVFPVEFGQKADPLYGF